MDFLKSTIASNETTNASSLKLFKAKVRMVMGFGVVAIKCKSTIKLDQFNMSGRIAITNEQ